MELYESGDASIWSSPYVREQLLRAHLDPSSDAASRKPQTIKVTVDWIFERLPNTGSIIDLGCGPGLYAREYAGRGWQVVGVDINEAAIDYARAAEKAAGPPVRYLCQSYLDPIAAGGFDVATCIYCDFGALPRGQQEIFLRHARELLAPDGTLIFDVFGPGISRARTEGRSWEKAAAGGFWSESPCYVLSECRHFEEQQVWGRKYVVIPEAGSPSTYVLWDHYYSVEKLDGLLAAAGFSVLEVRTDIVRENDFTSGDVLFVRARRT